MSCGNVDSIVDGRQRHAQAGNSLLEPHCHSKTITKKRSSNWYPRTKRTFRSRKTIEIDHLVLVNLRERSNPARLPTIQEQSGCSSTRETTMFTLTSRTLSRAAMVAVTLAASAFLRPW